MTDAMTEFFGDPIHVYTREQAIRDDVLVDVSERAQSMGFKHPVAITAAAYADTCAWSEDDENRKGVFTAQETEGRLCDVLWMGRLAARHAKPGTRQITFEVFRVPRETKAVQARSATLVLHIGPGDNREPVLTIMLPGED